MTFRKYIKVSEKFITDNSPAILTAAGVVGTVSTAYFAGTASFKAAKIIHEEQKHRVSVYGETLEIDAKDFVKLTWKLYIPTVTTGAASVACIVGANRIGTRRAAAMAAAYTISDKAFNEYKEKVVEKLGANKEQKIHDEIQEERVQNQPSSVVITGDANVLCFETFSGRYFESTMEDLKWAQNALNHKIINDYYASLSDFYNTIGLPNTSYSEEVGWNADQLLELQFSTVMSENQKPCIAVSFQVSPIRNYYRIH